MQPRENPAACALCALPRTCYPEYARAAGRACRAARRRSTCAHHPHATRTTTNDFCLLGRPTRLPLDEVRRRSASRRRAARQGGHVATRF